MHETLFLLGREPELSVAELEAVAPQWGATVRAVNAGAVVLIHERPLLEQCLDRLGGSIKQATVLERWPLSSNVVTILIEHLTVEWIQQLFPSQGRIEFGMSVYGASNAERAAANRHGLQLKKELAASGRAVRLVSSHDPQLSAVTVQRNGLLKNGKELVFVKTATEVMVGLTTAVQNYQAYALRDYGRPAANPASGMLPPKLAQMMLNIAQVTPDDILLDPFCGSGTILQEAAMLGVKTIHGSDHQPAAVKSAKENLRWLLREYPALRTTVEISLHDVREKTAAPTVIVTEPDLGKPLHGHESKSFLQRQADTLSQLYLTAFQHWQRWLKPGGRVVMVWPEYIGINPPVIISLDEQVTNLGFEPQALISETAAAAWHIANRHVLTYSRADARVQRQIRKWAL